MMGLLLSGACAVLSLFLWLEGLSGAALETAAFGLMLTATVAFAWVSRGAAFRVLLPSWGFLTLFWLNYPVQYLATQALSESEFGLQVLRMLTLRAVWGQVDLAEEALRLMAVALCWLAFVLAAYLSLRTATEESRQADGRDWCGNMARWATGERRIAGVLLLLGLSLAGLALPLQIRFGIGDLTNTAAIDFRLGGVLYHLLVTFAPLVFLSAHLRAALVGSRAIATTAIVAYLGLAAVEGLLMSSRGYLALRLVEVCLLYFCAGRPWRAAAGWLVGGAVAAVLLYPVATAVRESRSGQGQGLVSSVSEAWNSNERLGMGESMLLAGSRFIGFSSLLVSVAYAGDEFSWESIEPGQVVIMRESGFTRWFTERVAGYGVGIRGHFSAPGLMGAGWLLGGAVMAVLAPVLLALTTQRLYERPGWLAGTLGPVAPVAMLEAALLFFNEGTVDISLTRITMTALALAVLAVVVRGLGGVDYAKRTAVAR